MRDRHTSKAKTSNGGEKKHGVKEQKTEDYSRERRSRVTKKNQKKKVWGQVTTPAGLELHKTKDGGGGPTMGGEKGK